MTLLRKSGCLSPFDNDSLLIREFGLVVDRPGVSPVSRSRQSRDAVSESKQCITVFMNRVRAVPPTMHFPRAKRRFRTTPLFKIKENHLFGLCKVFFKSLCSD